ncbi:MULTISPECIES: hypothetical protein [unclassified Streptomyces]|uniref:hypothetical protein n=1 Tax=unclassified Streptomyces TaxID=2593676 RepID=UPI00278C7EAB|nr:MULTISPECIES: hypothetical protein [unclassified Streptomyces]
MAVSPRVKAAIMTVGGLGIVSTPLYWLLAGPNAGQLAAACVQGTTGIVALIWAFFTTPATPPHTHPTDTAVDTGRARATGGGAASTGVRRPRGVRKGAARAQRTGDASAAGPDSKANSGVDYSS